MAKGNQIQLQFESYTDSVTGAKVTRLTPTDVTCHRNYFYQKCFTNDGNKLLFGGWFDNDWNCYLLDLQTQVATQLTEGSGDNTFGCFLSPDDVYLYYVKNERELRRVKLDDLSEQVIYTVPDEWKGYGTWVANSACTKMVGIEMFDADYIPLTDWTKFGEQFNKSPRSRLISIDIESGQRSVLLDEHCWMGHPIYRPFDDNTVAFCHEGPLDLVDVRMWLVNEDGTNKRKFRERTPEVKGSTHEFWAPDGSKMIYVTYMNDGSRWICTADPVTLVNEDLMAMPPCSHMMSNHAGDKLVADGMGKPIDLSDNSAGADSDSNPYIYFFDLKTKEARKVCTHNTSWAVYRDNRQVTHPHPSFTPDEQHVLYTSDFEGEPAIYIAEIPAA